MSINRSFWYPAISGFCALFVGLGLCRYAYTVIMPALLSHGWLTLSGAGYIGAGNLLGYLLAVYCSQYVTRYLSLQKLIQFNLLFSIISLSLCALHFGVAWFWIWRFVAGISGALLMIMTLAVILKQVPVAYKGRAAGIMFGGIGFGIIFSGSILPIFSKYSPAYAWLVSALLAILASFIAWPKQQSMDNFMPLKTANTSINLEKSTNKILGLISLAYFSYGVAMVPHTLFLVTYIHQTFKLSAVISGIFWSLFGIGATIGPFCAGIMADKVGNYKALCTVFALAVFGIFVLVIYPSLILCFISSLVMGMILTSIPSLISARVLELTGFEHYTQRWGRTTLYCAISQAIAAYIMSYFLHRQDAYLACFIMADIVFLAGFVATIYAKKRILTDTLSSNQYAVILDRRPEIQ
jgi:MFS family permease